MRNIRPHKIVRRVFDEGVREFGHTASFRIWSRQLVRRGVYAWVETTVYVPRRLLRRYLRGIRPKPRKPSFMRPAFLWRRDGLAV